MGGLTTVAMETTWRPDHPESYGTRQSVGLSDGRADRRYIVEMSEPHVLAKGV